MSADETTTKVAEKPDKGSEFTSRDLVEFALTRYRLGRSTDGLIYVTPTDPRLPRVAQELNVNGLRAEISRALWVEKRMTAGREMVSTAVATLVGLASEQAPTKVSLRSARVGAALHVDLGDTTGRYVEVSRHGWELRDPREDNDPDAARAIFRRTAGTKPLPAPEPGGSRDDLRRLLGFEESDPRWRQVWGWLVAALFEDVPRPLLWVLGPQGSGKSTRARMALCTIDPAEALGREPGKNERDDSTAAAGRYLPSWDNVSGVSSATSDWLCRLVTGVEIGRRTLFTDDGLWLSTLRRSGVATSIVLPFGLGPDALERLVLVEVERVAEEDRRPESSLWAEFTEAHPRILGALLDDVAVVMRHLHSAREEARSLPRMADYSLMLHALDAGLDLDPWEGFAEAYARSVVGVLAERATSDPLTAGLLEIVRRAGGEWSGSADTLLRALEPFRPDDSRAAWPTTPASLSAALIRNHETLRAAGLDAERRKSNGARRIILRALPTDPALEVVDDDEDAEPEAPTERPLRVVPIRRLPGVGVDLEDALA